MALSGLYMRWPRGRVRRSWRAWFGINPRLIGRAFTVRHLQPGTLPPRTVAQWVLERNQDLHEGRVFGRVGTAIMASAALCLPVFYVTGWMMYLKRRAQRKRVASLVAQRSP